MALRATARGRKISTQHASHFLIRGPAGVVQGLSSCSLREEFLGCRAVSHERLSCGLGAVVRNTGWDRPCWAFVLHIEPGVCRNRSGRTGTRALSTLHHVGARHHASMECMFGTTGRGWTIGGMRTALQRLCQCISLLR